MRSPLDTYCAQGWAHCGRHWLLLLMVFAVSGSVLAQPAPCAGAGVFAEAEILFGDYHTESVALGDLDGDGDLDAFVVYELASLTRIFFNQGGQQGQQAGTLLDSGQQLSTCNIPRVSLGDLDGDGDLDAFISCGEDDPHRVHINQGGMQGGVEGFFSYGGEQDLGNFQGRGNALGDVDGDGDLDAWVANYNQPNTVWTNNGGGTFTDSGQTLGNSNSYSSSVALGDLDGDGDLDYHGKDNIAVDKFGKPLPMFGRYGETRAQLNELAAPPVWWPGTQVLPARDVETHVLARAGARPWDRDADDLRVLFFVAEGRGEIIDDEREVGGYPRMIETRAPFVEADWDLDTMEPRSGRYPGQTGEIAEHLSDRDKMMRQGARP